MLGKNVLTVPKEDPLASRSVQKEESVKGDSMSPSLNQTKDEFVKSNGWFIPSLHAHKVCE